MYDMILQGARSLGVEGMERLVADLKAAILSALAGGEPDACPRCGCARVVRRGRGAGGSQRWLCRGCGRSFSASTGRVLALSKLPAVTWASYVEGMAAGVSLARLAARCGVCVKTSWFMRMRVLEVMRSQLQPMRGGDGVSAQADELYLNESFSGRRSGMPREPHANGHGVRSPRHIVAEGRRRHRRQRPGRLHRGPRRARPPRRRPDPRVNVNPSFTDSTNAIAPIAPTHPRRFRRRQAPFPASRSGARSFVR